MYIPYASHNIENPCEWFVVADDVEVVVVGVAVELIVTWSPWLMPSRVRISGQVPEAAAGAYSPNFLYCISLLNLQIAVELIDEHEFSILESNTQTLRFQQPTQHTDLSYEFPIHACNELELSTLESAVCGFSECHCGQGARSACALHCPTPSNGVIATRDIFGNVPEAVLVVPDDADNTMACLLSLFDSPSRFLQYRGHAIWILTLDLVWPHMLAPYCTGHHSTEPL
ncbi:hypothetical protein BC629DRAFT_1442221 [Irpex lacteus]|nr:hypothetical protein BC629DRAFT_1442221 [Irpex lacteus]